MKTLDADLQAMHARGTTTLATALRVVRPDGSMFGFTSHDENSRIGGETYSCDPGLSATDIVSSSTLDVGNLELTALHNGVVFTPSDILGGVWRNSDFYLFRYDWTKGELTLSDVEPLIAGVFGEVRLRLNTVVVELRDLRQYLQHKVGEVSSKTCRYRLGGPKCGFPLSDIIVVGTIDTIFDAKRSFADSGRSEANDWFGWGKVTFTSGNAEGLSAKVESYDSVNKRFTLTLPLFVNLQVGDTYIAEPGCRGRFEEDCDAKFSAIVPLHYLNFGGEPHRRGLNNITAAAEPG